MENHKEHNHSEMSGHNHKEHHHEEHTHHAEHGGKHQNHGSHDEHKGHANHHQHMIADFRKRFWISLAVSVPILFLSPLIQNFLGISSTLQFNGDKYFAFILSTFVFFYGGYPFLKGMADELKKKQPGMMTLIAVAISVAYFLSLIHI